MELNGAMRAGRTLDFYDDLKVICLIIFVFLSFIFKIFYFKYICK